MDDDKLALIALLAFYSETGIDAALTETAVDRLAMDERPPKEVRASAGIAETPSRLSSARAGNNPIASQVAAGPKSDGTLLGAAVSPEAARLAAHAAAKAAQTLEQLRAALSEFEACSLRQTATQLVFADGNPAARVMFVGEAPGREEDIAGLPFVGRSGKLLDRMMAAIGLDRSQAYIANMVPWRPPGNRTPTPQESAICLPFTLRQIELADPDILVCLGGPSAQTLLNVRDGILKTRGRWFPFFTGSRQIRAMATLHPAYLLRQPVQKRLAWRDFLSIKQALSQGAQT
jgi:uracil-DNA glycosylase family 4